MTARRGAGRRAYPRGSAPPSACPARAPPLRNAPEAPGTVKIPLIAMLLGSAALKAGDKAPPFSLPDTDGKPVSLTALLERGPVILAFFPKAFTPG